MPRPDPRSRERRQRVAHEAARLMAESGLRDYPLARRKAAARLGIDDEASLPNPHEIEDALREYQRLFAGDAHAAGLRMRREAALRALEFFAPFAPRLVGPVLDGTADAHSPVQLHLHADDPDAVARFLEEHGIPAQSRSRRLRLDRARNTELPAWTFSAEDLAFDLTVLPHTALHQPPLSRIDDKPMHRASAAQLRRLLADEESASQSSR
ncbi:MAG: hypothetical protein QM599_06950 [Pseudoxanthomonas sp.]